MCRNCPIYKRISEAVKVIGEKYNIPLGVSCGVVKIPVETENLEEALKIADNRVYKSKRSGKGKIVID